MFDIVTIPQEKTISNQGVSLEDALISKIDSLEPDYVKWKSENSANQVVVKDSQYYYKIYKVNKYSDWLKLRIIELLGEYYSQVLGIGWEIVGLIEEDDQNTVYIVEKRQALHTIRFSDNISIDEMLDRFKPILLWVEERLELESIREKIKWEGSLKLIRTCIPKFDDYALYKDNVILLDDADFVIALVDPDGNICPRETDCCLLGDDLVFMPSRQLKLEITYTRQEFWTIRKIKKGAEPYFSEFKKNFMDSYNKEIARALKPLSLPRQKDNSITILVDTPKLCSKEEGRDYLAKLSVMSNLVHKAYILVDINSFDPESVINLGEALLDIVDGITLITTEIDDRIMSVIYSLMAIGKNYHSVNLILLYAENTTKKTINQIPEIYEELAKRFMVAPVMREDEQLKKQLDMLSRNYDIPWYPLLGLPLNVEIPGVPERLLNSFRVQMPMSRDSLLSYISDCGVSALSYPLFYPMPVTYLVSRFDEIPSWELMKRVTGYGIRKGMLFEDLNSIREDNLF